MKNRWVSKQYKDILQSNYSFSGKRDEKKKKRFLQLFLVYSFSRLEYVPDPFIKEYGNFDGILPIQKCYNKYFKVEEPKKRRFLSSFSNPILKSLVKENSDLILYNIQKNMSCAQQRDRVGVKIPFSETMFKLIFKGLYKDVDGRKVFFLRRLDDFNFLFPPFWYIREFKSGRMANGACCIKPNEYFKFVLKKEECSDDSLDVKMVYCLKISFCYAQFFPQEYTQLKDQLGWIDDKQRFSLNDQGMIIKVNKKEKLDETKDVDKMELGDDDVIDGFELGSPGPTGCKGNQFPTGDIQGPANDDSEQLLINWSYLWFVIAVVATVVEFIYLALMIFLFTLKRLDLKFKKNIFK